MVSKDEQVGKLRAAVAARRDPTTVIVARPSALSELPLDEALDRIKAYSDTGAEAIMLLRGKPGQRRTEVEAVAKITRLPICMHTVPAGELDTADDSAFMVANRVRVRFLGATTVYSMAIKAIYEGLAHLKEARPAQELKSRQASADLLRAVDRTEELKKWEQQYVRD
jgi:carboxyvinyl-carboxyphosphonate phosphorylmutase